MRSADGVDKLGGTVRSGRETRGRPRKSTLKIPPESKRKEKRKQNEAEERGLASSEPRTSTAGQYLSLGIREKFRGKYDVRESHEGRMAVMAAQRRSRRVGNLKPRLEVLDDRAPFRFGRGWGLGWSSWVAMKAMGSTL
jgi:hypothetical protein